jgi:hypothetical protein
MPQFDSGAAEQIGRFSEGLLLRLLHRPFSGFADSISGRASEYRNREKTRSQNTQRENAESKASSDRSEGFSGLTRSLNVGDPGDMQSGSGGHDNRNRNEI